MPDHQTREEHIIEPQEQACPQCGYQLKPLGENVSELLETSEVVFKVIRHGRRKKACMLIIRTINPRFQRSLPRLISTEALQQRGFGLPRVR